MSYEEKRKLSVVERSIIRQRLKTSQRVICELNTKARCLQVIELGCGYYGRNLKFLSQRFPGVAFTGIDLSVTNQKVGENVMLIRGDIANFEPTKEYDCILSLAVIEHLVDPLQHFNLIYSLMVPASVGIMTTPTPQAHILMVSFCFGW